MKKAIKIILLAICISLVTALVISCGEKEDFTSIETPGLQYKEGAYTITVSSEITKFDLSSLFTVSKNATFIISKTERFDEEIYREVSLSDGENKFYIKVSDKNGNSKVYQFVIVKNKLCTVIFNTNGGTELGQISCEYGSVLETPVSLKPGYNLNWDYDFNNPITKDITINAEWIPNTYKISIDGTDKSLDVVFNQIPDLIAEEKAGYKFVGWQYNGAYFDSTKPYYIDKDITLTAVYEAQKYTINYVTIGGTNLNPLMYTVEDEIFLKPLIWEVGEEDDIAYEFAGWFKDADFKEKIEKIEKGTTGSIDLYAKWIVSNLPTVKKETIITFNAPGFNYNGQTQEVVVGQEYVFPKIEKNGYIFAGWQTEDGKIQLQSSGTWMHENESMTLVPNWTKKAYSITYFLNGGTNSKDNVEAFYITDKVTLYNPTKAYSTFVGWYEDENYETRIEEIPEGTYRDIFLYAKWEEITYTVSFNADGGIITQNSQTVVLGSKYSLITPVKLGYKFDGWYNGEELFQITGDWNVEKDVSLVAHWSIETYKIQYDFNEGVTAENVVYEYTIASDDIKLPTPTREGYEFLGWSLDNGQILNDNVLPKGSTGDRLYVAHWYNPIATNNLVYSIKNGVATVVGYTGKAGVNLTIPEEYLGYKVVAIGNDAFNGYGKELENASSNSSGFTTFIIPQTITRIGANAFKDCDDLKIQVAKLDTTNESEVNDWKNGIVIETGNDQVLDVILGKRPAIGWRPYVKREQ